MVRCVRMYRCGPRGIENVRGMKAEAGRQRNKKRNDIASFRFHCHVVLCLTDVCGAVVIQGRVRDSS